MPVVDVNKSLAQGKLCHFAGRFHTTVLGFSVDRVINKTILVNKSAVDLARLRLLEVFARLLKIWHIRCYTSAKRKSDDIARLPVCWYYQLFAHVDKSFTKKNLFSQIIQFPHASIPKRHPGNLLFCSRCKRKIVLGAKHQTYIKTRTHSDLPQRGPNCRIQEKVITFAISEEFCGIVI